VWHNAGVSNTNETRVVEKIQIQEISITTDGVVITVLASMADGSSQLIRQDVLQFSQGACTVDMAGVLDIKPFAPNQEAE
jgi:hypothetical protein